MFISLPGVLNSLVTLRHRCVSCWIISGSFAGTTPRLESSFRCGWMSGGRRTIRELLGSER